MRRTPELERFLGELAKNLGIPADEAAALQEAGDHDYSCTCPRCKEWWRSMGPDPDTMNCGPFSYEELGLRREDYLWMEQESEQ